MSTTKIDRQIAAATYELKAELLDFLDRYAGDWKHSDARDEPGIYWDYDGEQWATWGYDPTDEGESPECIVITEQDIPPVLALAEANMAVKATEATLAAQQATRDELIRDCRTMGMSSADIATRTGLSVQRVYQIISK